MRYHIQDHWSKSNYLRRFRFTLTMPLGMNQRIGIHNNDFEIPRDSPIHSILDGNQISEFLLQKVPQCHELATISWRFMRMNELACWTRFCFERSSYVLTRRPKHRRQGITTRRKAHLIRRSIARKFWVLEYRGVRALFRDSLNGGVIWLVFFGCLSSIFMIRCRTIVSPDSHFHHNIICTRLRAVRKTLSKTFKSGIVSNMK